MEVDQVVDDRLSRPDLLPPAVRRLADDLVGVLAVGQANDADLVELDPRVGHGQLPDERLERLGPERPGLLTGRVDVVGERDLLGVSGEETDLARSERGPERRDDVIEARLVGHQCVRVALDDHRLARLADRALGLVDEVERPALVEQWRRRGVQVFRPMVPTVLRGGGQDPPAEPDRRPVRVADREDDPLAESVVDAAPARLPRLGQPHLDELVGPDVALGRELPRQRVPAAWRIPELVFRDRLVGEAAVAEVSEGRIAGLRARQDRVVEGDRALEDIAEALLVGVLTRGSLVELDAGLRREDLERLGERQAVALHHEAEDVAALAAAEALPGIPGRRDRERRCLLAVEGAQTLVGGAGLLQRDRLTDDVDDAELVLDFGCDADRQTDLLARRCSFRLDHPDMDRGLSSLDKPFVRSLPPRCQDSRGVLTRRSALAAERPTSTRATAQASARTALPSIATVSPTVTDRTPMIDG